MGATDGYGALDTRLAHFGEDFKYDGAVVPPIFANSLFVFEDTESFQANASQNGVGAPYHYSRISNPTVHLAEKKIADLEGADGCKLTGSGMAAITDAIMACVQSGSHVVIPDTAYPPARVLITNYLERFGVTYTLVDGTDPEEVIDAFRPETSLCYLESPSSFVFRVQDVDRITAVTRERGIKTIFDNTYATPLFYRPMEHGVDIVCHSATKYMSGHSDTMAGAICGSEEFIAQLTKREIALFGNIANPFAAWLVTRGLRTLRLRVEQHQKNANAIAGWLETQPQVERVYHVGLDSHPQRELYTRQFSGSGGVFSFEPKNQDLAAVRGFCDALKLFGRGISWGGFESLVVPLRVEGKGVGEARWVIRLFIGLEDVNDLQADIANALLALG